jgi:hypothetical protein
MQTMAFDQEIPNGDQTEYPRQKDDLKRLNAQE